MSDLYEEIFIFGKKYYMNNGMLFTIRNYSEGRFDYVLVPTRTLASIILQQNTIILEGEC